MQIPLAYRSGTSHSSQTLSEIGGGGYSSWLDGLTVTITNNNINHPLQKPSKPNCVDEGYVNHEYHFSSWTYDIDENMVQYGWDWDDDQKIDEWTNYFPSEYEITTSHKWNDFGVYHIKVVAEDGVGIRSEWSNTHIIQIQAPTSKDKPFQIKYFI